MGVAEMGPGANELKVQLETRGDLSYVEEQVRRALPAGVPPAEAERFMAALGAVLRQNVQVDGVDWERLPADGGVEQVDAGLESRLAEVQKETDALLVRVGGLRRTVPAALADELRGVVRAAEARVEAAAMEGSLPFGAEFDSVPPAELDGDQLERLAAEIERLSQLGTSIPALVAKLQRAQALLKDAPHVRRSAETPEAADEDEAAAQRRNVARQHEMAARLLQPM